MTAMVINSSFISAIEFTFNSPDTAEINEDFLVDIDSAETEKCDIKIFVKNSDNKIISEIYDDDWKNPYYYLKSVFPDKKEFKIRIVEYSDESELCVRLRISGKSNFKENCKALEINKDSSQEDKSDKDEESNEKEDDNDEKEDDDEEKDEQEEVTELKEDSDKIKTLPSPDIKSLNVKKTQNGFKEERIILNNKLKELQKTEKEDVPFLSKKENLRLFLVYIFAFLCVLIIVFLALKKL